MFFFILSTRFSKYIQEIIALPGKFVKQIVLTSSFDDHQQ